jgi:hypothetical protein
MAASREKGKMQAKYRQRRLTICRTVNQGNGKRISEWVTEYAGRGGTGYVFAIEALEQSASTNFLRLCEAGQWASMRRRAEPRGASL